MVFSICSLYIPATFSPCSHALHSPASPFTINPSSSCLFASLGTKGGGVRGIRTVLRQLHQCVRVDAHGGAEPPGECMHPHPSLRFAFHTSHYRPGNRFWSSTFRGHTGVCRAPPTLTSNTKLTYRLNPLCPITVVDLLFFFLFLFLSHPQKFNHVINAKSELPAFLIKPVQRICKYPLLLDVSSSFPSLLSSFPPIPISASAIPPPLVRARSPSITLSCDAGDLLELRR